MTNKEKIQEKFKDLIIKEAFELKDMLAFVFRPTEHPAPSLDRFSFFDLRYRVEK